MIDFDNESTPPKSRVIGLLSERVDKNEERVDKIEATITAAKGHGWKAALAIVTTLLGSATAIVATLQSKAEREGMMTERVETIRRDIAELKARGDQCRATRRDYDYDLLAPRPVVPPRKDP